MFRLLKTFRVVKKMFGVENLTTRLSNMVRLGKVSKVYPERHSARVTFEDKSGLVSSEMPVLVTGASKNKVYALPDVGEAVVCLMQSNDLTAGGGYIIGSLYTSEIKPAEENQEVRAIEFADKMKVSYDRQIHKMELKFADGTEFSYDGQNHSLQMRYFDKSELAYDGKLKIKFSDGSELTFDGSNWQMNIKGDIKMSGQNIELKSSGKMTLNASSTIDIKGSRINLN